MRKENNSSPFVRKAAPYLKNDLLTSSLQSWNVWNLLQNLI